MTIVERRRYSRPMQGATYPREETTSVAHGDERRGRLRAPLVSGSYSIAVWVVAALILQGCSIEKMAVRSLAEALGSGADVFATDDDPELVGQALPFALKTFEILLESDPRNAQLLLSTCSGFTQYAYAYVDLESEKLKPVDYRASKKERQRATKLYLRAREYCFRALDLAVPGTTARLLTQPTQALEAFDRSHIPLLYWTAGAWGSAISSGLDRPELVVDLPSVRALLERCLHLDEAWGAGALHDGMIALEAVPETMGGSAERARQHYERSLELSGDSRVGSHLAWAWSITVAQQDRAAFESTLGRALAVDLEASPASRLANEVNREFSQFLLGQADELFLEPLGDDPR